MTNEEINKLSDDDLDFRIASLSGVETSSFSERFMGIPSYCNNWNDLMPLVVEHKINLCFWSNKAQAYRDDVDDWFSETPQRALAECLLQVLIAKGE